MARRLFFVAVVLGAVALMIGGGLVARWWILPLAVLSAVAWIMGRRRRDRMTTIGLVVMVGTIVAGIWLGIGRVWAWLATLSALTAFELDRFLWQVEEAGEVWGKKGLEMGFLRRLLLVDLVGAAAAAVGLWVRIELRFGWILLAGILAILALSQLIGFVREADERS